MKLKEKISNPSGLHRKYVVSKADGSPVDEDAVYFVLRVDSGGQTDHVEASRAAMKEYALKIRYFLPKLAADILKELDCEIMVYWDH